MQVSRTLNAQCGLPALPALRPGRLATASRPCFARRTVAAAKQSREAAEGPVETASTPEALPEWARPPQQQQYQAVPQYAPAPRAPEPSFWSSIPPLIWVGIGLAIGAGLQKAVEFVKGGPQKMQEIAMQQMMNQMMKQMGAASGAGASPFAAGFPAAGAGASPFGAGSPFGAAAGSPFGAPPAGGFPSGFPNMQPPIDTTATPAAAAPAAASTAAPPASGTSSTTSTSAPKKKSSFVDVDATTGTPASGAASAAAASGSATTAPPPPPPPPAGGAGMPPPPFQMPPPPQAGAAGAGAAAGGTIPGASGMLEMLRDPEMQKMLYPYLPEPMRNPETFNWMLDTPEYRQQLEQMMAQQANAAGNPEVMEMMKGIDMSPDNMKRQLGAMGMSPDQFIQKIMSDPDLATSMTKPEVMAAIADCTKNPMNIFKYQDKPEVMKVFEKMSTLFPQAGMQGFPPQ